MSHGAEIEGIARTVLARIVRAISAADREHRNRIDAV